mmetsp:Transcript_44462/g.68055  ORF Transcript_44462/g.68055 Transcript_44462/m.68055 type:complete len:190 (+) Transcript_44462:105-674(+)
MTIVATEDNRNLEWRKNNVGSTLLQKMGWKEGQGIGKRGSSNTTALRALKRQDGLGLGAKMANEGGQSESANHFSAVLANLQAHHEPEKIKKKKKKAISASSLVLPQNKVVAGHAQKRRDAKFGPKTAQDLACIFGNPTIVADQPDLQRKPEDKRKCGAEGNEDIRTKKRRKKEGSRTKDKRRKEKTSL